MTAVRLAEITSPSVRFDRNGYTCSVYRQARKTTYVRIEVDRKRKRADDSLVGQIVQLDRETMVELVEVLS